MSDGRTDPAPSSAETTATSRRVHRHHWERAHVPRSPWRTTGFAVAGAIVGVVAALLLVGVIGNSRGNDPVGNALFVLIIGTPLLAIAGALMGAFLSNR